MTQTGSGTGTPSVTGDIDTAVSIQIDRLRRMTSELTTTTYSDADMAGYIELYPLEDARGEGPWIESDDTPGTLEENPDWTPTYDLNAAAADIWEEKAAGYAACYDFSANGGNYSRSQMTESAQKMARNYRSRRSVKTITQRPEPLRQGREDILDDDDD